MKKRIKSGGLFFCMETEKNITNWEEDFCTPQNNISS